MRKDIAVRKQSDPQTATHTWVSIGGASQEAQLVNNLPANAGDTRDSGSIPGSGRPPEGGDGNPLQQSCWNIREASWATAHGVTKESDTTGARTHTRTEETLLNDWERPGAGTDTCVTDSDYSSSSRPVGATEWGVSVFLKFGQNSESQVCIETKEAADDKHFNYNVNSLKILKFVQPVPSERGIFWMKPSQETQVS